ncbi:MAG: NAD-dependent epimerase/dehydratase family protein [Pirellulaceae bacterium]
MSQTSRVESVERLDELLSEPTPGVLETLSRLEGDILILGVGGKMGPTLARMAAWASQAAGVKRRVIGVARFSRPELPDWLRRHGVEPHTADLLDPAQLAALPEAANVVVMTALKFGSTGRPGDTWAVNCWLPVAVCQRFPASRIVGFSTGNVYPLTPLSRGGSIESDPLVPAGEYAASCVGRERLYDYFSRANNTPLAIVRLNYACELRYGVLVDLARQVLHGEPIDLSMGAVNVIWQGDANAMTLQAFGQCDSPPFVLNVAGPETISVRRVCEQLGHLLGKPPVFTDSEGSEALLSNGQLGHQLFGYPRVSVGQLCEWIADWLRRGGLLLDKPTKFQVRDGKF